MFLNEIKFHNPEFLINTFLCDNDNNFSYYKTVEEFNRDIYNLKQVIKSVQEPVQFAVSPFVHLY